MTTEGPDRLMTAAEVASLLQVNKGWVYEQTRRRCMPHIRLGRYVRYRRSAVEGCISPNWKQTAPDPRNSGCVLGATKRLTPSQIDREDTRVGVA